MTFAELLTFLNELGTQPKRGLSQNFLIDQNVVRKIIHTADIQKGDVVLEIGPGPGALTTLLLEKGAIVYCIEKDPIFAKALHRLQTEDQRLTVHCADALEFPLEQIPFQKVVANLPYHITTPLLEKCFAHPFQSLTLMVQKEVADRIFAKNGTKDFGSLSLFAQYYAHLKSQFTVSANCFFPKPNVDSAVIHLVGKEPLKKEHFFPYMRRSFQQRRKMLSRSLQEFASPEKIRKALLSVNVREDARPEMMNLDQWISFVDAVNHL
ncbi:MAG TPA: 16S rRNA (adenine(1518)-N(6)/adenine(1519)-N(6))-dimethyltransferase RsmA [Chlamydiales bacterium]|nr:16S rRNA (adenine(1518)-N(6)/adenine(1519)-N(6))-dimethyltransferase RsmA [Chlamydiales bacterium]